MEVGEGLGVWFEVGTGRIQRLGRDVHCPTFWYLTPVPPVCPSSGLLELKTPESRRSGSGGSRDPRRGPPFVGQGSGRVIGSGHWA